MESNNATPYKKIETALKLLNNRIIGQDGLISRLMIALLCGGHLLVEGAPGLAKTRAIKELADLVEGDFHRIQFTPDLLPGDVTGTDIFRPEDGTFRFQHGPVFHNLILADEINRAPAKVQSALLEAMGENQVSIGRETFKLPELFLVMATQNPIEQEGTHALPEAQLDRFLIHVQVDYPERASEAKILQLVRKEQAEPQPPAAPEIAIEQSTIFQIRREILDLHMAEPVERYIIELILESRKKDGAAGKWLEYGASPRGTIALDQCARALAWLQNRDFVTPDDVQLATHDALRHRLILNYEAYAEGISTNRVIDQILESVPAP